MKHYEKVGDTRIDLRGVLGKDSYGARFGDQVTVEIELSRPAYAYLVAFRPDGMVEPLFPEDSNEPPPLTDRPRYPSKSRELNYDLTDGTVVSVQYCTRSLRWCK
ncbi:DUF4384 domain-containing protein [Fimbriiglobus ruber]|uniref:DUF4384 domain-containing protein n=1 Tax=Fimbriiglobus ruber TaxID=1908690 RepID=UPI00137A7935